MLILTALLAIIIIICGFFIIYTVHFRFLKILIIVPPGAIACSSMAGNRMVSHIMATYCKYFPSCVFEAVTMALAIVVCNAFINAGLPAFTNQDGRPFHGPCHIRVNLALPLSRVREACDRLDRYVFNAR